MIHVKRARSSPAFRTTQRRHHDALLGFFLDVGTFVGLLLPLLLLTGRPLLLMLAGFPLFPLLRTPSAHCALFLVFLFGHAPVDESRPLVVAARSLYI